MVLSSTESPLAGGVDDDAPTAGTSVFAVLNRMVRPRPRPRPTWFAELVVVERDDDDDDALPGQSRAM
jgi:hypothetical protein